MRKIKFRIWDKEEERMSADILHHDFPLNELFTKSHYIFMQYIGERDINGKEIYEGDIVRNLCKPSRLDGLESEDELMIIEFYNGAIANGCEPFIEIACAGWQSARGEEMEVIGNIYENPDLAEKVKE